MTSGVAGEQVAALCECAAFCHCLGTADELHAASLTIESCLHAKLGSQTQKAAVLALILPHTLLILPYIPGLPMRTTRSLPASLSRPFRSARASRMKRAR